MRFPGFEGEWETKMLGEVAKKIGDGLHGTPAYVSDSEFYFINGNNLVNGKIELNENTKNIDIETYERNRKGLKENTLLISLNGTIGNIARYNNENVMLGKSVGYFNFDKASDFIYFSLQTKAIQSYFKSELTGSTIKNLSLKTLRETFITFPYQNEQNKIVSFLSLIDERISTQNKIIEELKLLKITISKKLFSRQLRFKNGNNENHIDWNTKKLGEVTTLVNKRNKNNEKLPVYSINNKLGFVPQSEQFEGVDSEDRGYDIKLYKIIDKNTFAYNPARINVGSIGYSKNLENIIISSLYVCFKTDNTINDNFLYQYLKTDFFNREVLRNVEGGVRDYLFYDNFARIKFGLPCIEEQKKIADYLSSIDSKIDIESQLLHKFEKQKRYLLANLFI
ncbi:restriction endonuclease subunit S [Myroides phaeus]|uniref:Type I restriction enzyme, S subunit n=1 Tax=Myroides phaeus TaxID=702745 RepID=A0A1G8DKM8_9FLAO|nr:restriction endonuclease subunit S [Myroides phaeus]SDH58212.1 type I restriction enzyme, S subunit [Myroides phaeus]